MFAGDTQKGDGEGWRNETLITSTPVKGPRPINNVDADDPAAVFKEYEPFVPVPWDIEEEDCTGGRLKYGTLEFDFVSSNCMPRITNAAPMPGGCSPALGLGFSLPRL